MAKKTVPPAVKPARAALCVEFAPLYDGGPANLLRKCTVTSASGLELGPFVVWASKREGERYVTVPCERYRDRDGKWRYVDHVRASTTRGKAALKALFAAILAEFRQLELAEEQGPNDVDDSEEPADDDLPF